MQVTSHGGHHAVSIGEEPDTETEGKTKPILKDPANIICDICSQPHNELDHQTGLKREYSHGHSSLRTREWFVQFGHRAPDASLYDTVPSLFYGCIVAPDVCSFSLSALSVVAASML